MDEFMEGLEAGYYDRFGVLMPPGVYLTVQTCPAVDWVNLSSPKAKKLIIMAKYNVLQGQQIEDWKVIKEKRIKPARGKIQKPKWQWNRYDHDFQNKFVISLDKEVKEFRKFEQKMSEWCSKQPLTPEDDEKVFTV